MSPRKLTVYFGERDRVGGRFLADAIAAIFARRALDLSIVLRGAAGFGVAQRVRTDRLLSLSEDLPVVTVAVDEHDRIQAAQDEIEALSFGGLVTAESVTGDPGEHAKLTVYGRRGEHRAIVAGLRAHGVAGATALLGVDGTVHGVRHRARLVGDNRDVPVMIVSVGETARIEAAAAALGGPLHTLERVRLGVAPGADKLTVYTSEATGQHEELLYGLRRAGAAGATVLRGVWGYHGDHAPHGDRLLQLRRRVPVLTVIIDTPDAIARIAPLVQDVTAHAGLVTSEVVPVQRPR